MIEPGQAIKCPEVDGYLTGCLPYLSAGGELSPEPARCSGVKSLIAAVKTPADKRDACNCVQEAANHFPSLKDDAAQALPRKCGVTLDIPISKSVNCDNLS
ncbi:non-specific lipid-transfer protein A-like [Coffea eugenioides]|uniref:non-specific lipid-transfer protein A-like n=1 Tax=Coffea eugenioides TaxID=49369 RepID=UPI000F60CC18|nr:non-specific lipid-transfer protein A-like [Coffea eugenioides]